MNVDTSQFRALEASISQMAESFTETGRAVAAQLEALRQLQAIAGAQEAVRQPPPVIRGGRSRRRRPGAPELRIVAVRGRP